MKNNTKEQLPMKTLKAYLFAEKKYPYTLPALPYEKNALEPHFDQATMIIHHTKHHQAYIDNLNKALTDHPDYQNYTLEELLIKLNELPVSLKSTVQNHGGGHYNHSLFWQILAPAPEQQPTGTLLAAINKDFGSYDAFKESFNKAAKTVFGSGWAWLSLNGDNRLVVTATPNQNCPLSDGLKPILGLDVWEHAYYLKYQNRRPDYIENWWHVINWKQVVLNFEKAQKA